MSKRLILAPHADDEAMGCGGLLAKYPDECRVVIVARMTDERRREFEVARQILGYTDFDELDRPDCAVGADPAGLVKLFDDLMAFHRPEEVYLPYPSVHQDHIAVYEAGVRAVRISMSEHHWFPPSVLVYDVAAYDLTLYPTDLRWNVFEALDLSHVDRKARVCLAYESQTPQTPHPISEVIGIAAAIGAQRRTTYAEQYALLRSVRGRSTAQSPDSQYAAVADRPVLSRPMNKASVLPSTN